MIIEFEMFSYQVIESEQNLSLVRIYCSENAEDNGKGIATGILHKLLDEASRLLDDQWPQEPKTTFYREKLIHPSCYLDNYGLPCSYLLVREDLKQCVGHGRLTECFESSGGNAAAVTFVVIGSETRAQGYGTILMNLLEKEAERLGYHYVYLWTRTAIQFYHKIGYSTCPRVSLMRDCLKRLQPEQVESLEMLLMRKQGIDDTEPAVTRSLNLPQEAVLLPPSTNSTSDVEVCDDVWMRKRLVEEVGSVQIKIEDRLQEIQKEIQLIDSSVGGPMYYIILSLPWQAQIGPSCGLAALRMAREYFLSKCSPSDHGVNVQLPSLLGEAQTRNYTVDGEIFNANHLQKLAQEICGLDCQMWSTQNLAPRDVYSLLQSGGIWILPYDSNPVTHRPANLSGKRAHYGIIVGMVLSSMSHAAEPIQLQCIETWRSDLTVTCLGKVFLIVQHSLSIKFSLASWSDYLESNQQLIGVNEAKFGKKNLDLKGRIIACKGMIR